MRLIKYGEYILDRSGEVKPTLMAEQAFRIVSAQPPDWMRFRSSLEK